MTNITHPFSLHGGLNFVAQGRRRSQSYDCSEEQSSVKPTTIPIAVLHYTVILKQTFFKVFSTKKEERIASGFAALFAPRGKTRHWWLAEDHWQGFIACLDVDVLKKLENRKYSVWDAQLKSFMLALTVAVFLVVSMKHSLLFSFLSQLIRSCVIPRLTAPTWTGLFVLH